MKKIFEDKEFFAKLLTLVIPITLQNLISSSLNMVDNIMIGKLGENSIAAVGLVNQYFFIFMLCLSGINAGVGIFISQFWGREDVSNIKKMFGLGMLVSTISAIIFSILGFVFPEFIMNIFTKDALVVELGIKYLRIISVTFIITSITQGYSTLLRCVGIAKPPMIASFIGVLVNGFLNWVLIFGNFGFPRLGVSGAAIATSIARFIEMLYVIVSANKRCKFILNNINEMLGFNSEFVRIYFKTSASVIANELLWALGLTAYSIIYAKIGTSAIASMQIANTVNNMFMVLCIGMANAAAIIVGNKIGAGEEEAAIQYATNLGILTPILGLFTGIALWFTAPLIVNLFSINEDTLKLTIIVLRIMAVFSPLKFFNVLMIVGVFRGGGDTTYSMWVQLGTVWCFAIPAGFIAASYFKLPLDKVFLLICLEEVIKVGFEINRLRSKKWIGNVAENLGN